jgi:hypothetical protein
MEYRILGPLEVSRGGTQVALGAAKQRALLAILLVHANELVSSDRLIEELWPKPPETAANTLQVYVGKLRKALEPERTRGAPGELLVTRAPGYMLRVDPQALDAERFERLLSEGRAAGEANDHATAARKLHQALGLWRGPALADFIYDPFAQAEIARLEELRLDALEERIEADLALGRGGRLGRRARAPDRGQPVAGAPAGAAHARPLPLRAPGGCPRGLPADPRDPRRGARPRPEPAAATPADGHPPPGAGARGLDRGRGRRAAGAGAG